jgi:hypothetical protein
VPVTIIILDVNDNPPVFAKPLYTVSLYENSSLVQVFWTLNATDADEGANADLEYGITSGILIFYFIFILFENVL